MVYLSMFVSSLYAEKMIIQKDTCTPMFIEITRTWKQPRCPSTDEWMKKWYIYILKNCIICSDVDEPGVCFTEWSRSEREKKYHVLIHICVYIYIYVYIHTYMKSRKMVSRAGMEAQTQRMDLWTWVGWTERIALTHIHYHVQNRQLVWGCCTAQVAQLGALWWLRWVGCRGGVGKRSKGEQIYVYI